MQKHMLSTNNAKEQYCHFENWLHFFVDWIEDGSMPYITTIHDNIKFHDLKTWSSQKGETFNHLSSFLRREKLLKYIKDIIWSKIICLLMPWMSIELVVAEKSQLLRAPQTTVSSYWKSLLVTKYGKPFTWS